MFLRRYSTILALLLLLLMGVMMLTTLDSDALTFDEVAHIGAGYSYLSQREYRLNPEHPPLMKDLAALPLLFLDVTFPAEHRAWTTDVNGQWDIGRIFIFESGNDADRLIFWARIPMVVLTLFAGWFVFRWARERYGKAIGIAALGLYTFSPTLLAHGRLVTTDVAAAAGFLIATYCFVHFLMEPSRRRVGVAGVALGGALLAKFSVFLLIPFFIALTLVWLALCRYLERYDRRPTRIPFAGIAASYSISLAMVLVTAALVIGTVYTFHVWSYPPEKQAHDAAITLQSFGRRSLAEPVVWLADKPVLRIFGQYLLGFLMVIQRSIGGNTTYFLGEVSASGWWYYFPVVYLLKEPLPLLLAETLTVLFALARLGMWVRSRIKQSSRNALRRTIRDAASLLYRYFPEVVMMLFVIMYWYSSVTSNLNIGIRHVIPTFPFIYLLLGFALSRITPYAARTRMTAPVVIGGILLGAWYLSAVPRVYPHYLTYFNEAAGGATRGYRYVTDSNYDWGQDLKRLREYVYRYGMGRVHLAYFGGAVPAYYLGDQFVPWWPERGKPEGWFAISATLQQGNCASPSEQYQAEMRGFINGELSRAGISLNEEATYLILANADFNRDIMRRHVEEIVKYASVHSIETVSVEAVRTILERRSYLWLCDMLRNGASPTARAGNSIFIYHLK